MAKKKVVKKATKTNSVRTGVKVLAQQIDWYDAEVRRLRQVVADIADSMAALKIKVAELEGKIPTVAYPSIYPTPALFPPADSCPAGGHHNYPTWWIGDFGPSCTKCGKIQQTSMPQITCSCGDSSCHKPPYEAVTSPAEPTGITDPVDVSRLIVC